MIEAMKQALEFIGDVYAGEWHGPMIRREQIEQSLRQTIAEAEKQEPVTNLQVETVLDDMTATGSITIRIAPDGDLHIISKGKDSWTGNDVVVAIELTASGGRDGSKWYQIFRSVMETAQLKEQS